MKIQLTGLPGGESLCRLVRVLVERGDGRHGCAEVHLRLTREYKNYAALVGQEVSLLDDDYTYLEGKVQSVEAAPSYWRNLVKLRVIAPSIELEKETHCRVFQNEKKKLPDILKKIMPGGFSAACHPEGGELKEIVVQDAESDYDFLCRLAKEFHLPLFFQDDDKGSKSFTLGIPPNAAAVELDAGDILHQTFGYAVAASGQKTASLSLAAKKWFAPGSIIAVSGGEYVVLQAKITYADNAVHYFYHCAEKAVPQSPTLRKNRLFLGRAEVIDTADPEHLGRIKLKFLDYEDALPENQLWANYLTPLTEKNLGMIYIPDKGETVEVYCRDNDCTVLGCRRTKAIPAPYQEVADRMLCLRGKHLIFFKDKLEFYDQTNKLTVEPEEVRWENKSSSIRFRDDQYSLAIKTKDKPQITVNGEAVNLETKQSINLTTKAVTAKASGEIGIKASGNITVTSGAKAALAASSVEVKAAPVDIKTNNFNVG